MKGLSKYNSTKFWLTAYSLLLFPFLLFAKLIDGSHFVTLYPLVIGLYFGGNVWAQREAANSATAVIKAKQGVEDVNS